MFSTISLLNNEKERQLVMFLQANCTRDSYKFMKVNRCYRKVMKVGTGKNSNIDDTFEIETLVLHG